MIYALGIIALLMIIIATLSSITLARTKWARDQIDFIQDTTIVKAQVEAAASDMATYFDEINRLPSDEKKYLNEIINDLQIFFDDIRNRYDVEIIPINFEDTSKYSYEFLIRYTGEKVIAEKRVFLSMMPSFLFFALGSNTDLNINGGIYIDGNIYINDHFYLANTANYILNNNRLSKGTSFPTLKDTSSIFFSSKNYNINACFLAENCFSIDQGKFIKQYFGKEDINLIFNKTPTIREYPNNFLDVNFAEAFLYYIEKDIITPEFLSNYNLDIDNLSTLFYELYEDNIIENFYNRTNTKSALINDDYVLTNDLNFSESGVKKHWIIVNGDLEIKNYDNNKVLNINANFLVNGNITITGYVQLNSTIYALGKGLVHNASINVNKTNENEQLVLLTKESLKFSKINEFDNRFLGIEIDEDNNITINPTIKGFFYTDSFAEIYTVNSYLVIEGGIFSNDSKNKEFNELGERIINSYITNTDSIGLLINSFQGTVKDNYGTAFNFTDSNDFTEARFIIKHNTSILETQPKGLPLTKNFNFLFEESVIRNRVKGKK